MPLARLRVALLAALALSVAACKDDPPTASNPIIAGLSVITTSSVDTLVTGDTALITFRFTNNGDTPLTLTSGALDEVTGKPCPTLLPVAAYPGSDQMHLFILSTCYGAADTTLTGQLGLQTIVIAAHETIVRAVPFTGYSRANATATPRCLATGKQWVLPLFLLNGRYRLPAGASDVDGPELLYLKPPTANPLPCSTT